MFITSLLLEQSFKYVIAIMFFNYLLFIFQPKSLRFHPYCSLEMSLNGQSEFLNCQKQRLLFCSYLQNNINIHTGKMLNNKTIESIRNWESVIQI